VITDRAGNSKVAARPAACRARFRSSACC